MNILMINATMKKGKSYTIGRALIDRIAGEEDQVQEIFLPKDMPEFCRGCARCIREGEEHCPDYLIYLKRITGMMDEADLLIFATPVFVYHTSGQMKALLDHYGYRWMVHRPEGSMFRKQAVCIATAAGAGMRSAIRDIRDSLRWWGVSRIYTYGVALPWDTLEEADEKKKDEMREKLEQIASRIQRDPGKIFPSPGVWIRFHIMRIFQRRKKEADIDQRYWAEQGWLGRKRPWKET